MTANTLYESVAPLALWRQLLRSILSDIFGDGVSCEVWSSTQNVCCVFNPSEQGIGLVHHILTTYHTHDEETETVHLPVNFVAILDVLAVVIKMLRYRFHLADATFFQASTAR